MSVLLKEKTIPKVLIYEQLDGVNIYYSGYESVLDNLQNAESVMGSSGLQSFVIEVIKDALKLKLGKEYRFLSNEVGLHLANKSNLSADIAIFKKEKLPISKLEDKYITIAPEVVIEIDTKADFTNISPADYFNIKTQKLLDFGVQKVIWIYTTSQKIMVATADSSWQTMNWENNIEVLGEQLNVLELLKKEGFSI